MASDGDLGDFEDHGAQDDARRTTIEAAPEPVDPLADDFKIGDPVVDLANGRNMVVVGKAADRADAWSERNDYDLLGNTGNGRLRARPADPVYTCVYVASVDSKPTKSYDFPSSRLGRPEYENVDGVDRVYRMVARDVFDRLFQASMRTSGDLAPADIAREAGIAGFDQNLIDEAAELAEAATLEGGEDGGE
ncbi:hypothetical protein BRC81_02870 [Halobacteriales archaeon QS_1_68_20]|nr:MAG: hypothetical protein BRC81_02870 [Halobacteriales archaeon QS_1_68_20]